MIAPKGRRRTAWITVLAMIFMAGAVPAARAQDTEEKAPPIEAPAPPEAEAPEEADVGPKPPEDLEALIKEISDLYRAESSIARMELVITTPRRTRSLEMKTWTRGEERALIVIEAPPREKGMATLKVERNLWNYLPRINRTIRIPPSMMLASWMGSDFSNDDLVRESSLYKDYTYTLRGRSEDPAGWVVDFEAKPDIVGLWKRIEFVITTDPVLPVRARYYDRKDRLSRTMRWSEVREFDGRSVPARMTLVPEDEKKKGHRTELLYLEIRFNPDVPDDTFSLSRLERKR